MSEINIRIANEEDAEALHQLMYDAFTPLRKLGIDWPSVNADLNMVKENIVNNTTFVMEKDNEMISTITVRYPWGSVRSISDILSYGGLLQSLHTMDRVWESIIEICRRRFLKRYIKSCCGHIRYFRSITSLVATNL